MSGFNHLNRPFHLVVYDKVEQTRYDNLTNATTKYGLDTVFVADDSEWDVPTRFDNDYHRHLEECIKSHLPQSSQYDVDHRLPMDVVSHQYVAKYGKYPAIGIAIFRNPEDKPFCFWDLVSVVRFYLNYVGYEANYSKKDIRQLSRKVRLNKVKLRRKLEKAVRIPPITYVGFFAGVDITTYQDWKRYVDSGRHSKQTSTFINLNKHEFFSSSYSVIIKNPSSRGRSYPVTIQFADAMALGPQGGLKKLGEIIGQPKLNTKRWDLEDGLISYRQYNNPSQGGYYKGHMRYLLDQRPDDYLRYALGDSEVTLKYLDFIMGNVIEIYKKHLIKKVHIPTTLTSLGDEVSSTFAQKPYDDETTKTIYDDIFDSTNIDQYLRPNRYNQQPPKDKEAWDKLLMAVVHGDRLPSDKNPFSYEKKFIELFKPYLAKGSIVWQVSNEFRQGDEIIKPKRLFHKVLGAVDYLGDPHYSSTPIKSRIDYQHLYADNPSLDIKHFPHCRIKYNYPKFQISTKLRSHYADHARQIIRNRNNVPLTVESFIRSMYDQSVYRTLPIYSQMEVINWSPLIFLSRRLDFDRMRKGYDFVEPTPVKGSKHQRGAHDRSSVRPDSVYNDGFKMAKQSYTGGMNISFNSGVINHRYEYKYDVDLKSSYV